MSGDDALTKETIREKLDHMYEKIKNRNEENQKKKRPGQPITNNIREGAINVASTVISLMTQNVLKVRKNKSDDDAKEENEYEKGVSLVYISTVVKRTQN